MTADDRAMRTNNGQRENMEVCYRNTFWDLLQFNLYSTFRSKVLRLVFLGMVILSSGYLTFDAALSVDASWLVYFLVFVVFLAIGFAVLLSPLLVLNFISAIISYFARNRKWSEYKVQATKSSLLVEAPTIREEISWAGIEAIQQNKRFIFIYVSRQMAHIVPKRAFPDEASADKFFAYISELWRDYKG